MSLCLPSPIVLESATAIKGSDIDMLGLGGRQGLKEEGERANLQGCKMVAFATPVRAGTEGCRAGERGRTDGTEGEGEGGNVCGAAKWLHVEHDSA